MNIQQDVDLFPHATLRMRAKAKNLTIARSREDLIEAFNFASERNIPLFVIGGGSNLAIISPIIKGLVVKNVYMKKETVIEAKDHVDIRISSGYPVTKIVNETVEDGFEGLEYHLGLPGSVGGALYMNSKWTYPKDQYFADTLVSANLLDKNGKVKTVDRDYFKFRYDYSILHDTKEILLEATFRFKRNDPKLLKERAEASQAYRKKTQPHGKATSGCFFQNITEEERQKIGVHTRSAGNLIDRAGLKNYQVGNFFVSTEHANFIINKGEGDPTDLAKIIRTVKEKVKDKFGIELREEVVVI